MGAQSAKEDNNWENPVEKYQATLYYFSGRGLADQMRWMMAATNVSFTQKVINQRHQLVKMSQCQLPFGQLPLLQIDGIEIVQSQAAVRYLARRAHIEGKTPEEMLKCDMIAEAVRDLLSLATSCPFKRAADKEAAAKRAAEEAGGDSPVADAPPAKSEWEAHLKTMKDKWSFIGGRFEAILRSNARKQQQASTSSSANTSDKNSVVYLVGDSMTYADILVAHITTWFVEECGPEITQDMPLVVALQNEIISLPSVRGFIKSINFFPIGDDAYVEQVRKVLNRHV